MAVEVASSWLSAEAQFQAAYARFLTDEEFRAQVLGPAASEEPTLDVSPVDIDRLRAMYAEQVELFAQCLLGNRIAAIEEAFPLTFKIIGHTVVDLVRTLDKRNVAV